MDNVSGYKRGRDQVKATDWLFAILLGVFVALAFLACDLFIFKS